MSNAYYDNLPTQQLTIRSRILKIPNLKLIEKVGDGGMATVWKAWDIPNQRLVAVKILNREYASDGAEVRAFRAEERILEEIHHPGIVEAYDFDNGNGNWYYIMEFVDGYTFADLLRRKQHVREQDCLLICESVAAALDYAWNDHGVVHCDIKPENIMINTDGVIKLTDLGISHRFESQDGPQGMPDHVFGTPAYISPEQVYGDMELDCRADIYSLAATLYHLSTGRLLFPGLDNENMMRAQCDEGSQARDPRAYRPELSEGFCQMLEAMLVKNRDYRIAAWTDVFQMCRDIEDGVTFKPRQSDGANSSIKLMA
ncbi:MAG: serine/threonine protein kinase [Kiritimatiellae bacterium]|nr:serine/threonine protein kinase [Kiritimatiellia bacterium]MBQ3343958.1 serine/threonine protein kinase [Kiritimatiellia bacterium]MBQ6329728.1 serine/threonine protein kinase [Kiritimatiellia bacterium]